MKGFFGGAVYYKYCLFTLQLKLKKGYTNKPHNQYPLYCLYC